VTVPVSPLKVIVFLSLLNSVHAWGKWVWSELVRGRRVEDRRLPVLQDDGLANCGELECF
jgi:hypothetical protein